MDWNEVYDNSPRISTANFLYQNVLHGKIRSIQAMIDRKIDINARNDYGENILIASLRINDDSKRSKIFQYLLKKKADVHYKDEKNKRSVLSWICVLQREREMGTFLQDFGDELDLLDKDNDGNTALHHATKVNNSNLVRMLLKLHARYKLSVDAPDSHGLTPYILARRLGHREIATILLEEGKASPAQFDNIEYRSGREWSHYGRREREDAEQQRQYHQIIQNKINGDFKKRNSKLSNLPSREVIRGSKESVKSLPPFTSRQQDETDGQRELRKGSRAAMSLLDLSSYDRGHLVRNFRHSEFDKTKISEYKDIFGDLHVIMDVLSSQKTPSFRKSAVVPPVVDPAMKKINDRNKVSSLAIIMGKQAKKVNKPSPRKTPRNTQRGNTPRYRTKILTPAERKLKYKNETFNKNRSVLPQIDVNNKVA